LSSASRFVTVGLASALSVGAIVAAGCSGVLGLNELTPYRGNADGSVVVTNPDGGPSSVVGAAGSSGALVKAPCNPDEKPDQNGVFVSARAVDAGTPDGGTTTPLRSITAGIAEAKEKAKEVVYVDEDTYVETLVFDALPTSIAIDGGWVWRPSGWTRDCSENMRLKTVILSPEDIAVKVSALKARSGLRNLTVQTRPTTSAPIDTPATSRIAVLVRDDSPFFLANVTVIAASAPPGGTAANGADGKASCTTTTSCVPGAPGADAVDAPSASAQGTFSATGFAPADGIAGPVGTPGANGTPGGVGQTATDCNTGCATTCTDALASVTAPSGTCGCGGGGGGGGSPGRGGGASVALLAAGAQTKLEISSSELIAGHGGGGSAGGKGGAAGTPTDGAPGATVACNRPSCCTAADGVSCTYKDDPTGTCFDGTTRKLTGGLKGGMGAPGGRGANGGGGSGGPAYSVVRIAGANVALTGALLVYGNGGNGAGGAPGGLTGDVLVVP
jgi:hypothetical protein